MSVGDADWVPPATGNPGPIGDPANDPGIAASTLASAAPTTLAAVAPAATNGYYHAPLVTLSASEPNGPGVAPNGTHYTIDGGATQTYSAPFAVTGDGNHTITFWSVDTSGNAEVPNTLTLTIDNTPPVTTAVVTPTPVNGQVNGGPATITLTAMDSGSGVAGTFYTVDGGPTQTYTGPFQVSTGGLHTITYWSTDTAGNVETVHTLTVQINPQATTTVTGTVPSTLSISVGSTQPSLGAFVAGTAATYNATLGATITTSAATSTLQAADACTPTASCFPGHLVNTTASGGPYGLAQGLQVDATSGNASSSGGGSFVNLATTNPATILSYTAPVANDPVTLGFRQVIGANDPLRTGSYTKTITFTLSTNTP